MLICVWTWMWNEWLKFYHGSHSYEAIILNKFVIPHSTFLGVHHHHHHHHHCRYYHHHQSSSYHRVGPLVDQFQFHTSRCLWNGPSWFLEGFKFKIWHLRYGDGSDNMWLFLNALHYFRLTHAISVRCDRAATSLTDVLNGKKTHIFAGIQPGSAKTCHENFMTFYVTLICVVLL